MKSIILFLFVIFFTVGSYAQTWSGTTPGNINYTSGNVGIGTAAPDYKLDVKSTNWTQARFESTSTGYAPASILLHASDEDGARGQGIYMYNLGVGENWFSGVPYITSSDRYVIAYRKNTSFDLSTAQLSNALFTIRKTGNVGIGTTSPQTLLQIGNEITEGSGETSSHGAIQLNYRASSGLGSVNGIEFKASAYGAGYGWKITTGDLGAESIPLLFGSRRNSASWTERMRIDNLTGNVGIGTTNPEAKLTVKGKIVASEVQVKEIGTIPDYVFRPTYKLMPLNHVEDFVKKNYHLPEVPSEKEFKENGMNMAEMNTLLLKKIEELTLYAIDQNKQITNQNNQIANQNKQLQDQNKKILNLDKKVEELSKKSKRNNYNQHKNIGR